MEELLKNIETSYTAFHAVKKAEKILTENGFTYLSERDIWKIAKGGKYYVTRNESSLIAFCLGERFGFNIVASHTDSPCLKVKGSPQMDKAGACVLNTEVYGGPILSTFMDRKLVLAGRAYYESEDGIEFKLLTSPFNLVIPNAAIHLNREINNGIKLNPQKDMCPIYGLGKGDFNDLIADALSYDLYICCAESGYIWGRNSELISSPRLDNLEGVFALLKAFIESESQGINVLALFDNEEIGSRTRQGAASTFLKDTLNRISYGLDKNREEIKQALAGSMMVSLDNAHASHPNYPEYEDPTVKTLLGGGIAIKHNANYSYTTDAYSAAYIRKLFRDNNVKHQDYYVKSDLRSGGTLGIVSAGPVSIPSVDIGLPQLAMHSAVETAAVSDYFELIKGLKAFYNHFKI